jgi:hypothetical protein
VWVECVGGVDGMWGWQNGEKCEMSGITDETKILSFRNSLRTDASRSLWRWRA